MNLDNHIRCAEELSLSMEGLLVGKSFTIRNNRDDLCLRYWSLIFEHHQGILLLLRTKHCASAFALMRPMAEAFLRLHVVMYGTERELSAIKRGDFQTDLAKVGTQIDERIGVEPLLGPFLAKVKNLLHGFTHGGVEQLKRSVIGTDIAANFPDHEVRDAVELATTFAHLTTAWMIAFLDLQTEVGKADDLFANYRSQVQWPVEEAQPIRS